MTLACICIAAALLGCGGADHATCPSADAGPGVVPDAGTGEGDARYLNGAHLSLTCTSGRAQANLSVTFSGTEAYPEGGAGIFRSIGTATGAVRPLAVDAISRGLAVTDVPLDCRMRVHSVLRYRARYFEVACASTPTTIGAAFAFDVHAVVDDVDGTVRSEGAWVAGASQGLLSCDGTVAGETMTYDVVLAGAPAFLLANESVTLSGG